MSSENPGDSPVAIFPEELIRALARKDCVIVVGAGVSAASVDKRGERPPTWLKLLELMAEVLQQQEKDAVTKLIKEGDYLTAAEVIFLNNRHGAHRILKEQFIDRKYEFNDIHVLLGNLAQRVYITPNFDTIFDSYMRTQFTEGVSIKDQFQKDILSWLRAGQVLVIKNHGTIDDEASIVISRRQYVEQRVVNAAFFRVVDALFLTKTVLFVGCGLRDPDFQLLMEDTALTFPNAPCHYMIKQSVEDEKIIDKATEGLRNLKMIYYDGDHAQLVSLLQELNLAVESRRPTTL